jgi:GDPmannose 4,6-dehydratase
MSKQKIICIDGISGQLGSYFAEEYLKKDFKVFGLKRRSSSFNTERIDHLMENPNLKLVYGDLADYGSLLSFVEQTKPDYYIHAGFMSMVRVSFDIPEYTMDTGATGTVRVLEALRHASPETRFLNLASSEMLGGNSPPQNEESPHYPRSVYSVAKSASFFATKNYREAYDMFACSAINFNSESPRRGETFLPRKVTRAATRIKLGLQNKLDLGNLVAERDWQHSLDAVRAMMLILETDIPDDYAIGTGEMHSVKEFVEMVFSKLKLDWKEYVRIDPRFYRPTEVDSLKCDDSKFRKAFPQFVRQYSFESMVDEMIECDMKLAKKELMIKNHMENT